MHYIALRPQKEGEETRSSQIMKERRRSSQVVSDSKEWMECKLKSKSHITQFKAQSISSQQHLQLTLSLSLTISLSQLPTKFTFLFSLLF